MSKKNKGGSAFPETHVLPDGDNAGWHGCSGMTLRDYFAAKAMQGLIAASGTNDGVVEYTEPFVANSAYMMADAMLAERDK